MKGRPLTTSLGLLLLLAMTAPAALATPPDPPQGPGDDTTPPDPSGQGNETSGNETSGGNGTRDRDGSQGPPSDFPGPGEFPADPGERFPDEACGHAPARPSGVPSWVPVPFERCGGGSSGGDGEA